MSLEYYLLCREKYGYILKYLEGINDLYNEIIEITCEYPFDETIYNIFLPEQNRDLLINRQKHIIELKKICDDKISVLCKHEFIDDTIDITPDRSENITYCKICGLTK